MTTDVVSLSLSDDIRTAIVLMKGHRIGGLPVLDGDEIVGILDCLNVLGKDRDIPVEHIMDRDFVSISPDLSVHDAGRMMARVGCGRLLVTEHEHLVGIVTQDDLLPELGKSLDPITGLSRADAMRDWGIDALKRGHEITVIFLDLDRFGQFNKKYGHITGDRVLKHVSQILQAHVKDGTDILCRYAGDEFVIVTTRSGDDARALAQALCDDIRTVVNPDLPAPVSGSVGVHGGKRTKEREHIHYEATLDNLINLASRACTEAKGYRVSSTAADGGGLPDPTPTAILSVDPVLAPDPDVCNDDERARDGLRTQHRLKIQGLSFSHGSGAIAAVEVMLQGGHTLVKRASEGYTPGTGSLRLVAEATAQAACEFLPSPGYDIVVEDVNVLRGSMGEDIVLVTAEIVTPASHSRLTGSSIVKNDVYSAVAAALLNAVNRQIAALI